VIYDLRRDASTDAIKAGVKEMGLDWLNSLITRWVFKHVLLKRAYSLEDFWQMVGETPFRTCEIKCDRIGVEVNLRK
jgi:hypothetical protein